MFQHYALSSYHIITISIITSIITISVITITITITIIMVIITPESAITCALLTPDLRTRPSRQVPHQGLRHQDNTNTTTTTTTTTNNNNNDNQITNTLSRQEATTLGDSHDISVFRVAQSGLESDPQLEKGT